MIKNKLIKLLIILAFGYVTQVNACDVCGCQVGGGGLGPELQANRHYLGLDYSYTQFRSNIDWTKENESLGGSYFSDEYSDDKYHSLNLQLNLALSSSLRTFIKQPLKYHIEQSSENNQKLYGLGDPQFGLQWMPLNQSKIEAINFKQSFMMQLGVQAPLGDYQVKNKIGLRLNENIQLGTGSWAELLGISYTLRNRYWGVFQSGQLLRYYENDLNYQKGNQWSYDLKFISYEEWRMYSYSYALSFNYQYGEPDEVNSQVRKNRGGESWNLGPDLQFAFSNLILQFSYRYPIWQEFYIQKNAQIDGGEVYQFSTGWYF